MADLYSALIGGTPTTDEQRSALVQALRGQRLMGQLGQLSGDQVLAPVGASMIKGADTGAEQVGQLGLAQTRAAQQQAYQQAEMGHMAAEEQQAKSALAETVRQHNLEHQAKMWEYGKGEGGGTDPEYQTIVDKIGTYQMPPLNTSSTRNPRNINIMTDVANKYPEYDTTFFDNRKNTVKAFGGGGPKGDLVRSADVGVQHLGVLNEAIDALNNGNIGVWNSVKNTVKKELGLDTAPTDFAATKKIVADEIAKFITGSARSGGAVFDRKEMEDEVSGSMTPQALKGVVHKWTELMGGQIKGLKQEYEVNTKNTDFESKLTPQTRTYLGLGGASGPHSRHPSDIEALVSKYSGGS